MMDVCIVAARRTPIGRFLGSLSRLSAVDLAVHAAAAALGELPRDSVDQVIVGNILNAGQGMNIARQIGVRLQLPISTPAFSVNMMCGSGLHALILAAQAIRAGDANVILCGGTESMSNAPHILPRSRSGTKFGDARLVDTILRDGLLDAFSGDHMALTTERLADKQNINRQEQDAFAAQSQHRYAAAMDNRVFDAELASFEELKNDEHPRPETTAEQLAELKPAFAEDGTITAGNASGINDGAAMLVVASRMAAEANDWPVLATVSAASVVGCAPQEMGLGPVHAIRKLCSSHAETLAEFDTIEINEAFAAQTLACMQELQLDSERVNPCGGAIALGHPIGASGARLAVHLANRIRSGAIRSGLATLCVGGGMGVAVALHAPN
ncbi:MAG: acetyl-CoA C-acyltransferase [Fuerstiella sp.]|nr:acetyl-CoA C-acyltransferase [Fuerstiella sp.]MCP4855028.1 acetyl-CoA C-acyltransferase [Fuerstiella sp.]